MASTTGGADMAVGGIGRRVTSSNRRSPFLPRGKGRTGTGSPTRRNAASTVRGAGGSATARTPAPAGTSVSSIRDVFDPPSASSFLPDWTCCETGERSFDFSFHQKNPTRTSKTTRGAKGRKAFRRGCGSGSFMRPVTGRGEETAGASDYDGFDLVQRQKRSSERISSLPRRPCFVSNSCRIPHNLCRGGFRRKPGMISNHPS